MKSIATALLSGTLHAATISLSIPSFTGCQDQFKCAYSGFQETFNTQREMSLGIGTMTWIHDPSPAPDQHAYYQFDYFLNGDQKSGVMTYFGQINGEVFFWFLFQSVYDPHILLTMDTQFGIMDGVTKTPVSMRVSDSNQFVQTSAPIHNPEPATTAIAAIVLLLWVKKCRK